MKNYNESINVWKFYYSQIGLLGGMDLKLIDAQKQPNIRQVSRHDDPIICRQFWSLIFDSGYSTLTFRTDLHIRLTIGQWNKIKVQLSR